MQVTRKTRQFPEDAVRGDGLEAPSRFGGTPQNGLGLKSIYTHVHYSKTPNKKHSEAWSHIICSANSGSVAPGGIRLAILKDEIWFSLCTLEGPSEQHLVALKNNKGF